MSQSLHSQRGTSRDDPAVAAILRVLGRVYADEGNFDKRGDTLSGHLRCARLYPKARYPRGHHELVVQLGDLGQLSVIMNQFGWACLFATLAGDEPGTLSRRSPDLATGLNDLAWAFEGEGSYDLAEKHLQQAFEILQTSYPKGLYPQGHPHLATGLANLAVVAFRRGGDGQACRC